MTKEHKVGEVGGKTAPPPEAWCSDPQEPSYSTPRLTLPEANLLSALHLSRFPRRPCSSPHRPG